MVTREEKVAIKTRYTDAELEEFRVIILGKIQKAQKMYDELRENVMGNPNDIQDTCPTFKVLEEGCSTLSKEENGRLAQRQMDFITDLRAAIIRIENKTFGVCRDTGKLIPKERLRSAPHATLCKEAKDAEDLRKK